ncbi:MAG: lysophospholipase [Candidatus Omnitrophota bacterium]|jgi:alpha-beta hydrolase superfamily lysophospholipase
MQDTKTGIIYRQWAVSSPQAIVLLIHGLGGHSGRWGYLTHFFQQHSISSYALELKGFGETKDLKGHIDTFKTYFSDIFSLYTIIGRENPGKKVFLVGESLGGLIAFNMVILNPAIFDGLVCISPAFASRLKFSPLEYIKIFSAFFTNPRKQFKMPFDAQMCTGDAAYQKMMDLDPREHRLATPKLLVHSLFWQLRAELFLYKIKIPSLFLLAGEDKLVDPRISKMIFKALTIKDKTLIEYPDKYHALPIESGREQVFEDMRVWLEKRITPTS